MTKWHSSMAAAEVWMIPLLLLASFSKSFAQPATSDTGSGLMSAPIAPVKRGGLLRKRYRDLKRQSGHRNRSPISRGERRAETGFATQIQTLSRPEVRDSCSRSWGAYEAVGSAGRG